MQFWVKCKFYFAPKAKQFAYQYNCQLLFLSDKLLETKKRLYFYSF